MESRATPLEPMLTREDAAEELNVSVSIVGQVLRSGALHSIRVGQQYRIPRESLDAFKRGDPPPYRANGMAADEMSTWPPTPSMLGEDEPDAATRQARDDEEAYEHAKRVAAHFDTDRA